jgi:hypothetical protein
MAGVGDLEFMQRSRRFLVAVVALALGGVIGYVIPKSNATPKVETGTIRSVDNATADAGLLFTVKVPKVHELQQFRWQNGTMWRDTTGSWHHAGKPPCLVPGSRAPVKITVGVVDAQEAKNAPARTVVVWVKCYRPR